MGESNDLSQGWPKTIEKHSFIMIHISSKTAVME